VGIKDLFNDIDRLGTTTTASAPSEQEIQQDIESVAFAYEVQRAKDRFIPHIDYSKPSNFAKYGSAEEYYKVAIESIYNYYPYDGSLKEKEEWYNDITYFETFIFDKEYPRTNGFALLSADGWGTLTDAKPDGYGLPDSLEYIQLQSGPHKENIWDSSKDREENLKFALSGGATVEFWLKKDAFDTNKTDKEVIFDLWNGKHFNEHDYGRLRIELDATSVGAAFHVTAMSGTAGFHDAPIGTTVTPSTVTAEGWTHYAFAMENTGSTVSIDFYRNGTYVDTVLTGSGINHVTGTLSANIGALRTCPFVGTLTPSPATGSGKLSGSLDDFRYWKTTRTARDIGRYYISQVGGGSNTDDANTDLGVYYKFNEGITGEAAVDSIALDYSGRVSNGTWTGYDSSSRSIDSAMVLSGKTTFEFKDPIIYSAHPEVVALKAAKSTLGERYDIENFTSMYKSMPAWITEDDELEGEQLKKLTQIMSSYLDELHNQVDNLPKIKNIAYPSGSVLTGSFKPYPFAKNLVKSHGLDVPDLFVDTSILEQFLSRDEKIKYEQKIYDTKNLIYQNLYNNLLYIYKSKGTEKSIRNLIRAFGANEDIININVYGKRTDYEFRKNVKYKSIRKNLVDFNQLDRTVATLYNYQSGSGTTSYISGSNPAGLYVPNTVECEVVFPRKIQEGTRGYYSFSELTSSIFGQHTADTSLAENNLTWNAEDHAGFQVYAVRNKKNSPDAYFVLTGSLIAPMVTNLYKNVYDEEKWNFAVRVRPSSSFGNLVDDGGALGYRVEFYGVNQRLGTVENEFVLSSSMTIAGGQNFLSSSKRIYGGAHRTNFSGAVRNPTDVKLSYLRFWMDDVKDQTIQDHSIGMYSYGPKNPFKNATLTDTSLGQVEVPELETLALNWDFRKISSSADSSGRIFVDDFSSGSSTLTSRYGWMGNITKQLYTARVDKLIPNADRVALTDFIFTTKNRLPEEFVSSDMISIGEDADEIFTKDSRPLDYFFSIENSLNRVISEEIVNAFAAIVDFNNLIGEPVNKYRQQYKDLSKLRQLFFERIENKPDIEKYLDYFKHVDAFIQDMLEQLIPASSNVSDSVLNMVESHVLERNKYDHKFPTLESKQPDPITTVQGINEMLYNWKFGHAPITPPKNQPLVNFASSGNQYFSVPDAAAFSFGDGANDSAFSANFWLSADDMALLNLFSKYGQASDQEYWLFTDASGRLDLYLTDESTGGTAHARSTTLNGYATELIMVTVTYDGTGGSNAGSGISMYVNGTALSMTSFIAATYTAMEAGDHAFELGRGFDINYTNNKLGSFALFDEELSSSEITALYNEGCIADISTLGTFSDIVAWYKLEDLNGVDSSGYGFDGTYPNSATIVTQTMKPACNPVSLQATNCTYWHELAERGGSVITSGDATVDAQRETIKTVVNTEVSGSTYATRKLGKMYRFGVKQSNDLQGGSNQKSANLFGFHRQAIAFNDSKNYIKIPFSSKKIQKNCDEDLTPPALHKRPLKVSAITYDNGEPPRANDYSDGKASLLLPFTIFSSSLDTGYLGSLQDANSASFEGMHRDVVGQNIQRPLQGPFTEKYVGGLQYRHAGLNYMVGSTATGISRPLDTPYTRAEGWVLTSPVAPGASTSLLSESFSSSDPIGWTNVGSTATGPSGWILTHSGPTPSVGTGPTAAAHGDYYAYAETSTPNHPGSEFGLVTPVIDANDVGAQDFSASFYYHMHGMNVGNLQVQHSADPTFAAGVSALPVVWNFASAPTTTNTFVAGEQQASTGDPYIRAQINLSSYAGTEFYLRFLYQGGITYLSDIAIDMIEVSGTSGGSIYKLLDPSWDDPHKARGVYYRDEVAKRPLNIRNIKMTSSSPTIIGNYSYNYEVVNIAGRSTNNIWFVQNTGSVATSTSKSAFVSGTMDFALANRDTLQDGSKNRTVIAERFSAPGGPETLSRGFLDTASETYSVYNCLNYRNSTIRNALNLWEKHHSIWGGYDGIYGIPTASFHQVQRNTGLRIELSGNLALTGDEIGMPTITGSYFDNGFLNHQIPQTDAGYSWISGSIIRSVI
jgi:hypothetical protein